MEPENRWLRFGLSTNPYFVEPLAARNEGPRPISLFQGRDKQTKGLLDTIASEQSSFNVVEAPAGVGKSTFVNFAKHSLARKYFAPSTEVALQSGATAQTVLLQVIDVLVRHASDLAPEAKWEKEYPAVNEARRLVLSLQAAGWDFGFGLHVPGGAGGSLAASRSPVVTPPLASTVLSPRFLDALIQELLTLTNPPATGVILHVNNLDVLMAEGAEHAARIFGDLREHFQVSNTHWIFLGPPGLVADAIAPQRRVLHFLKANIRLAELPVADVQRLLQKRYEHYKIRGDYTPPTDAKLVTTVYDRFGGDLRGTLNALSIAHQRYRPIDVAPLTTALGRETLQGAYRATLESNLTPKTQQVLQHLIRLKKVEFTQEDATTVERHQSARSVRFAEMEQWDVVRLVRTDGPRKIYTLGGAARLAYEA